MNIYLKYYDLLISHQINTEYDKKIKFNYN